METDVTYSEIQFSKRKEEENADLVVTRKTPVSSIFNHLTKEVSQMSEMLKQLNMSMDQHTSNNETSYETIRRRIENLRKQVDQWTKSIQADKMQRLECLPRDWLWFRGSCYYFSNDRMDWSQSKENCTSMGSHLVIITSTEEQDFIEKQLNKAYWIGLSDQEAEGEWKWVNGTPLNSSTSFWKEGEPNNQDNEDCATVGGWGNEIIPTWLDVSCITTGYCVQALITNQFFSKQQGNRRPQNFILLQGLYHGMALGAIKQCFCGVW
ncbi:CD209 antigen-like protein E [Latimeria chalumnae]|uniref:CD209 antigen-like protein E n=1 Tax=Latimeria chalumnae TaxID=7897 RepID=UPI00313D11A5